MGRNKKIHDLYNVSIVFRCSKQQYEFLLKYVQSLDPNLSLSSYFRKHIDKLMSERR